MTGCRIKYILWGLLLAGLGFASRGSCLERTLLFTQEDLTRPDSLGHRHAMVLDRDWQYRTGKDGEWQSLSMPVPLRLQGLFTLRKYFQIDSLMAADAYQLRFDGIDGTCTIYLNKKIVGTHQAGTAPFTLPLAKEDLFVDAQNELLIELDTRIDYRRGIPRMVRNRGIPMVADGLFRPVILFSGQRPYVTRIDLSYEVPVSALLPARVHIRAGILATASDTLGAELSATERSQGPLKWEWEIVPVEDSAVPLFKSVLEPIYASGLSVQDLKGDAMVPELQFWRPRAGQLFKVVIRLCRGPLVVDQASREWGVLPASSGAGAEVRSRQEPLKIIEWVEDSRIRQLSGEKLRERINRDMAAIYALGADAVRVPGNMPDEYLLEVCDRIGLAALIEVPIVNIPPRFFDQQEFKQAARGLVQELVQSYRSHPSVLAWGLGSGFNPADERTQKFVRDLTEVIRGLDDRPVYLGVRGRYQFQQTLATDYRIIEISPEELPKVLATRKNAEASEIYQVLTLLPVDDEDARAAQNYQAFVLKQSLTELLRRPGLGGVAVSPFQDWRGDTPLLFWGPRQDGEVFLGGLLDGDHKQRMASEVVKASFTKSKMPEMLPGEMPQSGTSIFQIVGFGLIVLLLFFVKRDKRLNNYFRRVFIYPHGFYVDLSENRHVNVFLTALVGFSAFITLGALLASYTFHLRSNIYLDEILTYLLPGATAKAQAIHVVWQPALMILFYAALLTGLALLQSLVFKMIVLGQRRHMRFFQIVAFIFWVPANLIFALPLVVIFYRLLEGWTFIPTAVGFLGLILAWFFIRSLRGIKVLLQMSTVRAFLLQTAIFLVVVGILLFYWEQTRSVFAYAAYYRGMWGF
jgi:hypothetical protein